MRLALWTGEEQGLLGSRAYVKQHFADRETMQVTPEHARLAAYFNMDNGTGQYRGVYLQGNEMAAPIFEACDGGVREPRDDPTSRSGTRGAPIIWRSTPSGLPGFQFIQDPVQYGSRTHHSNLDVYDQLVASDMMKNAVITAAFVYHAANREEMLPRKSLPEPTAPPQPTSAGGGQ